MDNRLQLKRTIASSIESIFKALTDPEELKQWFAPEGMTTPIVNFKPKIGSSYRICMQGKDGKQYCSVGKIQELEEPIKLVLSWKWEGVDSKETLLTFSLKKVDENVTELILIHEGFTSEKDMGEHKKGWTTALNKLEEHLR